MLISTLLLLLPLKQADMIAPGNPMVDASIFKPYYNVWAYSVKLANGQQRTMGLWTDRLMEVTVDGKRAWKRIQGMTYAVGKTSSNVNVFDPVSLAPISSYVQGPDGLIQSRDFSPTKLTTHRTKPGEKEVTADTTFDGPAFDFWGGMYGTVLATLPLKDGDKGVLKSYAEFEDVLLEAKYNVLRHEKVDAGWMGDVDAAVVEVGAPGSTMTFWLSKQAPYIIRLFMTMRDPQGKPTGAEYYFKMIGGKDDK